MASIVCHEDPVIGHGHARDQQIDVIQGFSHLSQVGVYPGGEGHGPFGERQHPVHGNKFKKGRRLFVGIEMREAADDFVIGDDAEVDLFVSCEIVGKAGGNLGMFPEEHR